ncbi:hypothetical protein ILUMI_16510, partial [Ignelater luminosus]
MQPAVLRETLLIGIFISNDVPVACGILQTAQTACEKYGSFVRGWLTVIPIITVVDPKYIQVILNNSRLSTKNFIYSFTPEFLGRGMITTNGYKSKSHRKYISPYFKTNYLEQFVQTFDKCAQSMVEQVKGKDKVQITTFVNRCISNVLHKAIIGIPLQDQEIINKSPFNKGPVTLLQRVLRPWLLLNSIYKFTASSRLELGYMSALKEFSSEVLEKRKGERRDHKNLDWCLLDAFIEISEAKPDFTEEDIVDEIETFMLAGQHSVCA